MKPKLIIESHVPCIPEELGRFFDIRYLAPDEFNRVTVADADAMIIRTRTRCDRSLLSGSNVRFIATATIGTDHIDLPWCAANDITVASAPGCNAPAVAQYVMTSLLSIYPEGLQGKKIGVVGVGHVGSIVADWARQLGMTVLLCDPPRSERESGFAGVDLTEVATKADIITFHVPHTKLGEHATHHIADRRLFSQMRDGAVVINSARGPVVDTPALVEALETGKVGKAVIDCWEGEPEISRELLELASVATPHIAGYSLNGKIRATTMAVNALCAHFGIDYRMVPDIPAGAASIVTAEAIRRSYDPMCDTEILKAAGTTTDFAARFERMRNKYALRPEVE